ncbi:hypothetical protein MKK05_14135 [Pseudomonas aeruginosa]|uniref:hypothetical protein n=1 Tax=Pseudomonas aeruginosa TaxID=287 RepID=UPI00053D9A18|nr:hypothetical protein [Pseudomonas aeruginosa]UMM01334.1 hypothetical protein MKK05_14135 [Pseudomonas aeruginosa]
MSLLDEIIVWTSGLRPWQQEALRRIFAQPELTQGDIETILQMVREQESEGATGTRTFTQEDVPGVGSGATVRLAGVSGLDQINGFPSGRAFDLVPEGLTIFFGHNGAGKSGYARVFKNACKARHRVEVLPNAFEAAGTPRPPSADFAILVDGTSETARWVQNEPAHPHLSSVSVFDDPSTSLDHVYRRAIAWRLVALAESRQVLVFTHDAVFLTELAMALQRADCQASYKTIGWDELPGLVSEGLTWATMDTKARLADLRDRAKALNAPEGTYPDDELERQIAAGYSSLRGTVERPIREVFLNNTVQPFSDTRLPARGWPGSYWGVSV